MLKIFVPSYSTLWTITPERPSLFGYCSSTYICIYTCTITHVIRVSRSHALVAVYENIRIAWVTVAWQTGHLGSFLSQMRLAHSMQNRLWPQGTRAAITSLSKHTEQSLLPLRLVPDEDDEEDEEDEEMDESEGTPEWWDPGRAGE